MAGYLLRRLAAIIPILLGVSVVCFSLVHLAPGDAISAFVPDNSSPDLVAQIRKIYGFDRPLPVQYWRWLMLALHGDLGTSVMTGRPVLSEIAPAALRTMMLAVFALTISLVAGLAIGLAAGHARRLWTDRILTGSAIVGISVPHYWCGIVLVAIFSVELKWLPAMGMGPSTSLSDMSVADLQFMILPAITLAMIPTSIIAIVVRATVLEVRKIEFIHTLHSLGIGRTVIFAHTLKNIAPAVLTVIGMQAAQLLGGSILVETVFAWPGTGFLLNTAIATRDLPLLQGTILVLAVFFVLMNFAIDLAQPLFDPRIARG
jgi:peptide/nickel transport system permease protein